MSALDTFIETENKWARIYDEKLITRPTTSEECNEIFDKLKGELSPEILCCDGELSDEEAKEKSDHFLAVWRELEVIAGARRQLFSVWV